MNNGREYESTYRQTLCWGNAHQLHLLRRRQSKKRGASRLKHACPHFRCRMWTSSRSTGPMRGLQTATTNHAVTRRCWQGVRGKGHCATGLGSWRAKGLFSLFPSLRRLDSSLVMAADQESLGRLEKEGSLTKEGSLVKNLKVRHFCLYGTESSATLVYYETSDVRSSFDSSCPFSPFCVLVGHSPMSFFLYVDPPVCLMSRNPRNSARS